jgi:hypothetical protein
MSSDIRLRALVSSAALLVLPALLPADLRAQAGSVRGVVRDTGGTPIPETDVAIVAQRLLVKTNERGEFVFGRVQPGSIRVSARRIGFEPKAVVVELGASLAENVIVVLTEQPHLLEAMKVSEREMRRRVSIEAFYRRRAKGPGTFITREEIEARKGASHLSDVLRDYPGIRFDRARGGATIRFVNSQSQRRDCVPQIWIDGQRVRGMELDDFPVNDIEGIELYDGPSTTPLQYSSSGSITTCGTIVLWSRVPGT